MNDRPQDTDLRARFEAQRQAEASEAPSFASMMTRVHTAAADTEPLRPSRRVTLRRIAYAGGLAAAVIAALLVIPRPRSSEDEFEQAVRAFQRDPALGAWQSPTDGLLEVPGSHLISTMPSVGTPQ